MRAMPVRERTERFKEIGLVDEEYPLPEASSNRWITALVVNAIGITLIIILWLLLKKRNRPLQ